MGKSDRILQDCLRMLDFWANARSGAGQLLPSESLRPTHVWFIPNPERYLDIEWGLKDNLGRNILLSSLSGEIVSSDNHNSSAMSLAHASFGVIRPEYVETIIKGFATEFIGTLPQRIPMKDIENETGLARLLEEIGSLLLGCEGKYAMTVVEGSETLKEIGKKIIGASRSYMAESIHTSNLDIPHDSSYLKRTWLTAKEVGQLELLKTKKDLANLCLTKIHDNKNTAKEGLLTKKFPYLLPDDFSGVTIPQLNSLPLELKVRLIATQDLVPRQVRWFKARSFFYENTPPYLMVNEKIRKLYEEDSTDLSTSLLLNLERAAKSALDYYGTCLGRDLEEPQLTEILRYARLRYGVADKKTEGLKKEEIKILNQRYVDFGGFLDEQDNTIKRFTQLLDENYSQFKPFKDQDNLCVFRSGSSLILPHEFFYNTDRISGIRYYKATNPDALEERLRTVPVQEEGRYTLLADQRALANQVAKAIELKRDHTVFVCLGGGSLSEEIIQIKAILERNPQIKKIDIYSIELHGSMSTWKGKRDYIVSAIKESLGRKDAEDIEINPQLIEDNFLTCNIPSVIQPGIGGLTKRGIYNLAKSIIPDGKTTGVFDMIKAKLAYPIVKGINSLLVERVKKTDYVILGLSNIFGNLSPEEREQLADRLQFSAEYFGGQLVIGMPLEDNLTNYESLECKMLHYRPLEILGVPYDPKCSENSVIEFVHVDPKDFTDEIRAKAEKNERGDHRFFWRFTKDYLIEVPAEEGVKWAFMQKGSMIETMPHSSRFTIKGTPGYENAIRIAEIMQNRIGRQNVQYVFSEGDSPSYISAIIS